MKSSLKSSNRSRSKRAAAASRASTKLVESPPRRARKRPSFVPGSIFLTACAIAVVPSLTGNYGCSSSVAFGGFTVAKGGFTGVAMGGFTNGVAATGFSVAIGGFSNSVAVGGFTGVAMGGFGGTTTVITDTTDTQGTGGGGGQAAGAGGATGAGGFLGVAQMGFLGQAPRRQGAKRRKP